ncbi:hypothetical protein SKAU_G00202950 [Synaphobranchus kaupii]|uniref:Uncharacterized protein n=1 Tax=Synaphobranchus kaupii TaxID=118154 RepID=A0A9Q1FFY4_SYNKA|nr:hypothetical protein SKAU_G00202950 [Synaphobranchus kaupii]
MAPSRSERRPQQGNPLVPSANGDVTFPRRYDVTHLPVHECSPCASILFLWILCAFRPEALSSGGCGLLPAPRNGPSLKIRGGSDMELHSPFPAARRREAVAPEKSGEVYAIHSGLG